MTRSLHEHGISVTIATTHGREKRPRRVAGTVMSFPLGTTEFLPASFAYSPGLANWLEESVAQFNLLHIHTLFNYPSAKACAVARQQRVPYIVRPCGMLDPWSLRRSRWKKAAWMTLWGRRHLNSAAALHFTSTEEQRLTERLRLNAAGVVIPLGVEVLKRGLTDASGLKTVLFLSRLHPKKGLDLLIPALGDLARKRDDFRFVVAGGGEARHLKDVGRQLLEYGILGRTKLTGFVEGPDKAELLGEADIFVLPSYQENFGLAVAEAMAAGIPVVISDRVNLHPEVARYRAGLVTTLDRREIAAAIEKLLDDEALQREMGHNGQRLVQEKFNWASISRQIANLYDDVLRGNDSTARPSGANRFHLLSRQRHCALPHS